MGLKKKKKHPFIYGNFEDKTQYVILGCLEVQQTCVRGYFHFVLHQHFCFVFCVPTEP